MRKLIYIAPLLLLFWAGNSVSISYLNPSNSQATIENALANNLYIEFAPGVYNITATLNLRSGHKITAHGAKFKSSSDTLTIFKADSIFDFDIDSLDLEGNRTAPDQISTGSGIVIKGSGRYKIDTINASGFKGNGVYFQHLEPSYTQRGDTGIISVIRAANNTVGINIENGGDTEYLQFGTVNLSKNDTGAKIGSANYSFSGLNAIENINGIEITGGTTNHAHGTISNAHINHNTGYNIKIKDVSQGATFIGAHVYGDSSTSGRIIIENSKGIRFDSGMIDAVVEINKGANTSSGSVALFNNVLMNLVSISGDDAAKAVLGGNTTFSGASTLNNYPATSSGSSSELIVQASRSGTTQSLSSSNTLVFNSETADTYNAYNSSTGIFTAPSSGKYIFIVSALVSGSPITGDGFFTFWRKPSGGSRVTDIYDGLPLVNTNLLGGSGFTIMELSSGDEVDVTVSCPNGSSLYLNYGAGNAFKILRL